MELDHQLEKIDLEKFHKRNDLYPVIYVITVYLLLIGLFSWYLINPEVYKFFICFCLIAILQHHLSIIHHEAVHYTLLQNHFLNELIGSLSAFFIGFTMRYRNIHFEHHRSLGMINDPDLKNYKNYPSNINYFLKDLLLNLFALSAIIQFIKQSFLIRKDDQALDDKNQNTSISFDYGLFGVAAIQTIMLVSFYLMGHIEVYFLLWLLPLVTLTKFIAHFRNVAEHICLDGSSRYRTIKCNPLEQFIFAPMNFNYHYEHHFYPQIPFYNLPKVHNALYKQNPELYAEIIEKSYIYTLKQGVI